jgi:hypothetical protein
VIDGDTAGDTEVDVTAAGLQLAAGSSFGIGSGSNHLETTVSNLTAAAGSGGVFVTETDAVTVTSLTVNVQRVGAEGSSSATDNATQSGLSTGTSSNGHIVLVSLLFLGGVYGMFTYAIDKGYSTELARTIVVNTLVVMEIFHLFFIRNIYGTSLTWKAVRGTKVVWAVVVIITIAQFAITYLPPLQEVFDTVSIPFWDGVLIIGVGVALFAIIETEKQIRLAFRRMKGAS